MNHLINLYQQRLNLQEATFYRIDHDDAIVAIVYKISQPNNKDLILKTCSRPHDYLREVFFLKHFAGKLPVPQIVQFVPPEDDLPGAILMECLPGALLKIHDFTDSLAYDMGSLLARIHLERVEGYGDLTQPQDLNSGPHFHFNSKFEEGLNECENHLPHSLIDQCRSNYHKNAHLLNSVDGPCMIHRDFRAGNVLVFEGKISGIIDWSSGRASFAEDDFCPLEHGEWPSSPKSKESFLSGYANIRPVPNYKAIMPLLRLNRMIATIGFTVKRGTWESGSSHLYQYNRQLLESFLKNT